MANQFKPKHGHGAKGRRSPEYLVWTNMKQRCLNPNAKNYNIYGGRGIQIYAEWMDYEAFYKSVGPRPTGFQLDRIDPDGNYEPNNVRWVTKEENQRNKRPKIFLSDYKKLERENILLVEIIKILISVKTEG